MVMESMQILTEARMNMPTSRVTPLSVAMLLLMIVIIVPSLSQAQDKLELTQYCVFDGSEMDPDIYGFSSDQEARQALDRVMQYAGLEPNFILRAANVPNAVAAVQGSQRYIL